MRFRLRLLKITRSKPYSVPSPSLSTVFSYTLPSLHVQSCQSVTSQSVIDFIPLSLLRKGLNGIGIRPLATSNSHRMSPCVSNGVNCSTLPDAWSGSHWGFSHWNRLRRHLPTSCGILWNHFGENINFKLPKSSVWAFCFYYFFMNKFWKSEVNVLPSVSPKQIVQARKASWFRCSSVLHPLFCQWNAFRNFLNKIRPGIPWTPRAGSRSDMVQRSNMDCGEMWRVGPRSLAMQWGALVPMTSPNSATSPLP